MVSEEAGSTTMPQSPWKKPKIVSLSKSKSIKRKTELFSAASLANSPSFNLNNTFGAEELCSASNSADIEFSSQPFAKQRKTVVNRFSIRSSINFGSHENSLSNCSEDSPNDRQDLLSFFGGDKYSSADSNSANTDSLANKIKINESLANICPTIISNLSKTLIASNKENEVKKGDEEKIYDFENEILIPVDWSLKTRMRFLSTKPFSCYNGIKSQHESEAISNYSHFKSFYSTLENCKNNTNEQNKDVFKTLFCESISYWVFPYLPWLNLYPRNSGLNNLSSMNEPFNSDIQKTLSKSWNQSFKSLYNSLKSNTCPYFYLLTHSFIVLFRAQNVGGINEMNAILTPSTKGLRQALKDTNFQMPFMPAAAHANPQPKGGEETSDGCHIDESDMHNKEADKLNEISTSCSNDDTESNNNEKLVEMEKKASNEEEEDEDDEDTEEPDEWLEQIGLNSTVNFKACVLQRNNKNSEKNSLINLDNRPKSTLLFNQGSDVQALFNFLLNSKSCVSNSGPLTGVPPTLISPTPFIGANLQKIKVEQNVVKSLTSSGQSLTQYALDFIGPVMPYHVHRLCNLFRLTQVADFEAVANVYDQSAPLNCHKKKNEESEENDENDQFTTEYLDKSEAKSLDNKYGIFAESKAIRSILFKNNRFSCSY